MQLQDIRTGTVDSQTEVVRFDWQAIFDELEEGGQKMQCAISDFSPVALDDALLSKKDIVKVTRLGARSICRMVSDGRFPPPIRFAQNLIRWRHSDIKAWLTKRCPKQEGHYER